MALNVLKAGSPRVQIRGVLGRAGQFHINERSLPMSRPDRLLSRAALVMAAVLVPAAAFADYTMPASLKGSEEVPANGSAAKATGTIQILQGVNGIQDTVRVLISYSGIASGVTGAHIHGPANPGQNAAVIIPLTVTTGTTSGTISQDLPLSAANKDLILSGRTYVNIHSNAFSGGEIRSQDDSLTLVLPPAPGTSSTGLLLLTLAMTAAAAAILLRRRRAAV